MFKKKSQQRLMASKKLPQELESRKPRSLRKILNTENPKVIIEFTEEKVDLAKFVEYVLNFEENGGSK